VKLVLVVNPFATRVSEEAIVAVERELGRAAEVRTVRTERPRHATELVGEACRSRSDAVVVFSGDGGYNEALNGLHADVPIGFLPGGGTSVLPRGLGLPNDPAAAAAQIADALVEHRTRRITLGSVNGRRFAFSAGVGLDAEAVRRVDEMGRGADGRRPGDFAFARAVVGALASNRGHLEPALEVVGLGRAAFAFVANGSPYTYLRGIAVPLVPGAEFELGLDVVAPVRVRRRSLVRTAFRLLRGHPREGEFIVGHDLDRVELVCDAPMPLQADGEDLGDVERVVFEAQRGAIAVLA
jgi:diacylglycerol kinase family enzyme